MSEPPNVIEFPRPPRAHDLPALDLSPRTHPVGTRRGFNTGQRYRYLVLRRGQEVAAGVLRADTAALALGAVCDCLEYAWETDPEVELEIDSYASPDRLLARESREVPLRGPGRTPFGPGRNQEVFETTQELLEASAYWQDPPAWIHGPKTPDS